MSNMKHIIINRLLANIPMKKVFYYGGITSIGLFLFLKYVKPTVNINNTNYKSTTGSSDQQTIDQPNADLQQFHKLSVLPLRCIGCGKCAQIDSAHFEMSQSTGKAIVISSTNLATQNLAMAIQACPAQAITLE